MSSKLAHFDCQFGAAGDMLLAALLDAGVDREAFLCELSKLNLSECFSFSVERVRRCGLGGLKIHVSECQDGGALSPEGSHEHHGFEGSHEHHGREESHEHHGRDGFHEHHGRDGFHEHHGLEGSHEYHGHEGSHEHHGHEGPHEPHGHGVTHEPHGREGSLEHHGDARSRQDGSAPGYGVSHRHGGSHQHSHRGLSEITAIIQNSGISSRAKQLATNIFQRLGRAEARVHAVSIEEVHFHEVGAIDAIVDIVGFAIAYDLAEIESSTCTAVPLGNGTVKTEHGNFPIPAPAVVELLHEAGALTSGLAVPFECLTPTGAAILCEIAERWGSAPAFDKIGATGYGAGTKDPKDWPNVVRILIGRGAPKSVSDLAPVSFESEVISVIEANVDDQSPQAISFALEKILSAGALDVFTTAVTMKKSRSAHLLTVICRPEDETRFQEMILRETTSIGVRSRRENRLFAARRWQELTVDDLKVRVKLAFDKLGNLINAQPEFEDIALFSQRMGITIKEAQNRVMAAYYGSIAEEKTSVRESEDSK